MTLTDQQREEFEDVTRPVMQWLNNNFHPHVRVTVDAVSAELSEGVATYFTDDFLYD